MNNLNSILDYLKVFNNINKRKAYEPRTMAQEPRIGLQGGQLVQNTVDGSRPGYKGDPLKGYDRMSKKTDFGVTKMNAEGTADSSTVDKKIKKIIYTDKATGKKITVFKVKITSEPSQAKGTKVVKGDYKTLLSGPDKTEFSTLKEAQNARDKWYKKNPSPHKVEPDPDADYKTKRKREAAIKKNLGVVDYQTGTRNVVKGHASNIYGKNIIKPSNIIYTPKEINALMAGRKDDPSSFDSLDYKQRATEAEIERIKKSNMPLDKKKIELGKLDDKLMKYVAQSDGYKTAVLSSGKEYGSIFQGTKSQDMFDQFPGKSEKEVKNFVKQYFTQDRIIDGKIKYGELKPEYKKLMKNNKLTALDEANIIKSGIFNENVKNAQDNAAKVLKDAGIPCLKGVGGNCTTPEDFRKGFNQLVKEAADGKGSKQAISKLTNFTKGMRGLKGVATVTGYGLLAEAGFMIPFAVGDYAAGKSWKRILGNATDYGLGPIFGQSEFEEFKAALPEGSKAVEGEKVLELGERLERLEKGPIPQGRIGMDKARIKKSRENVITGIEEEFSENLQPFLSDTPWAKNQWHQRMWNQAHQDAADTRARIAKENFERAKKRDITTEEDYYGAATGGIMSLKKKR